MKEMKAKKISRMDTLMAMPIFMSPEERLFNKYANKTKCPPSEYEDRQGIVPMKDMLRYQ